MVDEIQSVLPKMMEVLLDLIRRFKLIKEVNPNSMSSILSDEIKNQAKLSCSAMTIRILVESVLTYVIFWRISALW